MRIFPRTRTLTKKYKTLIICKKVNTDKNSNQMSATVDTTNIQQAVEKDPSLMQEIVTFLTDKSPDPVPLERSSDPLFYDSSKNGSKLTIASKELLTLPYLLLQINY